MSRLKEHALYLESSHGTQVNGTTLVEFDIPLNEHIGGSEEWQISIIEASLPVSFYSVNDYNNKIIVDVGSGDQTVTLTNGNYTATDLLNELNDLGQDAGSPWFNITTTYSAITQSYTFTHSASTTWSIQSSSTALLLLGLSSTTHTATDVSGEGVITSDQAVDLSYTRSAYLYSPDIVVEGSDSATKSINTNVLACIPISVPNPYIVFWRDVAVVEQRVLTRVWPTNMRLGWLDDNYRDLDLRGAHWSIRMKRRQTREIDHNGIMPVMPSRYQTSTREAPAKRSRK